MTSIRDRNIIDRGTCSQFARFAGAYLVKIAVSGRRDILDELPIVCPGRRFESTSRQVAQNMRQDTAER